MPKVEALTFPQQLAKKRLPGNSELAHEMRKMLVGVATDAIRKAADIAAIHSYDAAYAIEITLLGADDA